MLVVFRIFLLLSLCYHILVTTLGFGVFGGEFPQAPALLRDGLWIMLLVFFFFSSLSSFFSYWKQRKKLWTLFAGLLAISIFFSYLQDKSIYDMFIGFKYGFHYIFLFLSATFLGHIFAEKGTKKDHLEHHNRLDKFFRGFIMILVGVVIFGYIWQIAKLYFPNIFFNLGYGPLDDFHFGVQPPIYYLTGFGGSLRRQGIFSGPNNYGYFLVAFLPLILSYFKISITSIKELFIKHNLISLCIYFLRFSAIFLTLSRSAILGTAVVLILFYFNRCKRHWKIGIGLLSLVFLGILGLSILKSESTLAHIIAKLSSLHYVIQKPLGYGLGSSGPAIHHNGNILPENYFIQLLIDIGVFGFALWSVLYYFCFKKLNKLFVYKHFGLYERALVIGWIGLLFMGIFLHVFEDSMVNYTFFLVLGLLSGYLAISKKELGN